MGVQCVKAGEEAFNTLILLSFLNAATA